MLLMPHTSIDLSRVTGILINSGTIRFEDNKALLNFTIQQSQNRTVMSQLGKIAEAIIVKRCSEFEEVNYRINYIIHDIINGGYCVPVICFPLMAFPNTTILTTSNSEKKSIK